MAIKMDLTKFKHVKSDDKSTTLQHADGHQLTLAHKALSKESQAQLAKMADSAKKPSDRGEIKADSAARGVEQSNERGKTQHGSTIVVDKTKQQDHGKVKMMAKGGDTEGDEALTNATSQAPEAPPQPPKAPEPKPIYDHARLQKAPATHYNNDKAAKSIHEEFNSEEYAQGGNVQQYAEGTTDVSQTPPEEPQQQVPVEDTTKLEDPALARKRELYNLQVQGNPAKHGGTDPTQLGQTQTFGPKGEAPQNFDPQDWSNAEQTYAQEQNANAAQTAEAQQKAIKENQARTAAGLPPVPVPNVPNGPQIPGSEDAAQHQPKPNEIPQQAQQQVEAKPQGMDLSNVQGMMEGGYKNKMAGIQQAAGATGALGEAQAKLLNDQVTAQQDAKIAYQKTYDALEQERQAHMADIKAGHIDPNQYWTGDAQGNGSHSKIASAVGMILAGFNPTSAPNAAINFLKYQMDQNMNAQMQNLQSKQNLLSANLRQFGNLKDATDMTRLMQHDIMQNELASAAAKAQTPMAKAAALQAAGQLQMEAAPIFQNFAMRRAMMNLADQGSNGDPSNTAAAEQMIAYARVTNPEMAKEMESRLIPGVGMAKKPVPESVVKELTAKNQLSMAAKDLYNYSAKHNNLVPGSAEYNIGVQKALNLQQLWRDGVLNTVFRDAEQPLMNKIVDENPAGLMKRFKTLPKLKELIESNDRSTNVLKQGYGLPTQQSQQEDLVKGKDGRMYKKVGNYMVPVK